MKIPPRVKGKTPRSTIAPIKTKGKLRKGRIKVRLKRNPRQGRVWKYIVCTVS